MTTRGRPREFDPETAVARAMNAFWSGGYHGTSLPDLLAATELSRGSLYAAFGDKHGLFLRALDRYIDESLARFDRDLDPGKSALAGVRTSLSGYVERTIGVPGKRGCLVVATAMELAAHDPEVERRIRRFFKAMEAKMAAALSRAEETGELAAGVDPAAAARVVTCFAEGLRVLGKTSPERAASERAVDTLLALLAR